MTTRIGFIVVMVLTSSGLVAQSINHEPMFGGKPKPLSQRKADEAFIQKMDSLEGGRKQAAKYFVEKGWFYYHRDILDTAMFRFNQAWLLDPDNPDIYWGFGSLMGKRSDPETAKELFSKGLKKDTSHIPLQMYLATAYMDYAMQQHVSENHKERMLHISERLLKEVVKKDPKNAEGYYRLAVNAFLRNKHGEAWKAVYKSRKLGGDIKPDFLIDLSAKHKDPRGEFADDDYVWGY
ncbi:hypothetical protein RCC89_02630 [Cytophagaceae bacterium ABcell3]|nr:hypothetical protein RCC89_02630 [Cytophagaceae bacterium ABcell3]